MNKGVVIPFIVILTIVAILAGGYFVVNSNSKTQISPSPTPAATVEASPTPSSTSVYKDGTYTAAGNYNSPGGAEEIGVTITLKDGVITASEVVAKATRPNSVRFQKIFVENYKPLVEGKNIDEVMLEKVSGSSLAPKGFNEALEEVKTQAKS